jgi:hypothetical protein
MKSHMFQMRGLVAWLALGAVATMPSCTSMPTTLCDLECECEHCNDWEYDFECAQQEMGQEVAEAYDCTSEWDAWASCVEEQGECDEEAARFSTHALGSCSGTMDLGIPCTDDAECEQMGGYSANCSGGSCQMKSCAGQDVPCQSNSDCPTGEDKCGTEEEALEECVDGASEVSLIFFGGGDQPPQPGGPEG